MEPEVSDPREATAKLAATETPLPELDPPRSGEVYNLGGGKENSCSILEAFEICESFSGKKQLFEYVDGHRIGDHICYYSDLTKIRKHYPKFQLINSLGDTIQQIVKAQNSRR